MLAVGQAIGAPLAARVVAAQPTRVIRATISDTADRPVPLAQAQMRGGPTVATDDSGRLILRVRADERVVVDIRRIGFIATRVTLPAGGDTTIRVTLFATPTELPRTVTTEHENVSGVAEFEERLRDHDKGMNSGHFVTAREIEQRNPTRTSAIFDGMPGVFVERVPGTMFFTILSTARTFSNTGGTSSARCPVTVYIDGGRVGPTGEGQRGVLIWTKR